MKVEITFSIDENKKIIDLVNYGYESHLTWEDLNEDEKNEIRDILTEQMIIECSGETQTT